MEKPICDVNVTGTEIQNYLSDYFRREIRIKSCSGTPIAAGQGFTSSIIRIGLEYETDQADLPKSVIVKSPNKAAIRELLSSGGHSAEKIEQLMEGLIENHGNESEAYRVLNIDRPIPIPFLYAATPCVGDTMGVMVMEDLGDRSEAICDPSITLNFDQLEQVVDAMGNLHSWCMKTDVNWTDHLEPADSERRKKLLANFGTMMDQGCQKIKELHPDKFPKLDFEKAKKLGSIENFLNLAQKHAKKLPQVIVHGDFYANNLMFEKTSTEIGNRLLGIVDWQLCHKGQGLQDLARLLTFNVRPQDRREYTEKFLKRYYDILMEKVGKDKLEDLNFEDLQKIYEDYFVGVGMFYVTLIVWLQNLFTKGTEEEKEKQKQVMLERCVAVYDDLMEILKW